MILRILGAALAIMTATSCGGKHTPLPVPVPAPALGPVEPDFKADQERRAKHMSWEYRLCNSTPADRQAVLTVMAGEVADETDAYMFLNQILNRVPPFERKKINLRFLVEKWNYDGPTRNALRDMFNNKFYGIRDLSVLNNNTHMNIYFSQMGTDQDGKPLVAWTIGETWTVVEVEDGNFPAVKVRVNR